MDDLHNFNFLKSTVSKFKGEIQKMIIDPTYSNSGVIQLKQAVDEIEANMKSHEKSILNNYLNERKTLQNNHQMLYNQNSLPKLRQKSAKILNYIPEDNVYITVKYEKQSKLDRLNNYRKNREMFYDKYNNNKYNNFNNEERRNYIKNMKKRKPMGQFELESYFRQTQFNNRRNEKKLIKKYGLYNDVYDRIKVTNKMPNFMDPSKRIKYSSLNKNFTHNKVLYDKNKQPIIKKDELKGGLLNMIYKGLIPKGADLSPAFENNGGNPLQINQNVKKDFAKTFYKDDYTTDNNLQYKYDIKAKTEDNFFITKPKDVYDVNNNNKIEMPSLINEDEDKDKEKIDTIEKQQNTSTYNKENENENNISESEINKSNNNQKYRVLIFNNYKVVENEEYKNFYAENQSRWGSIIYLFEHLGKLFKKLNFTFVEVYEHKILNLALNEMSIIKNKDLLMCISEKDLQNKNLDINQPIQFYTTLKEKFVVRIQNAFRTYLAKKKLNKMISYFKKIKYIQHMFRSTKLVIQSREKAKKLFENRYNEWLKNQESFKKKYDLIKNMKRVEIHICNISLNSSNSLYMNTTFNKFSERENNQLNRIINLYDPNLEIIYICPYEVNKDILAYYISIMETLGIENCKERFKIFVPDNYKNLAPHFSVSELLLLSPNTINEIKKYIGDKYAYIIPNNCSKIEVELSMIFNYPILMGDLFQSETIFTKSGSKLIFEANELNVPISAWDIKNEFEFYASLSHLIVAYPNYNVWIFKMDYEVNGRGIAYIQLDRIQPYFELKKNRDKYEDIKKYEYELSECLKKNIPKKVKICANNLYKSWDEFFKNYLQYRGLIEACPTFNPANIVGSPCLPILIEPNGNIEILPTYDKINLFCFRNIGAISPQRSIPSCKKKDNDDNSEGYNNSQSDVIMI